VPPDPIVWIRVVLLLFVLSKHLLVLLLLHGVFACAMRAIDINNLFYKSFII